MQRGDFVKISIIGIGGVGGYLAGYLKKYESGNLTWFESLRNHFYKMKRLSFR